MMQRNQMLDILKGICIVFVVITHFSWMNEIELWLLFPFTIDMAVPVFMLISGYVYAASYRRNNVENILQGYSIKRLRKSFLRYTIPYVTCFSAEVILYVITEFVVRAGGAEVSIKRIVYAFLTGGWGPGSYYYPILLELLIIYPLLWYVIRRFAFSGLLTVFCLNIGLEWSMTVLGVSINIYRLLIFRYIFLIGAGAYLYLYKNKGNKLIELISVFMGIIFIVYTKYFGNALWPLNTVWIGTSCLAGLYIIPLYKWFICINLQKDLSWLQPISNLGKASYNIFLFQMMYYAFLAKTVYKFVPYDWLKLCLCVSICLYGGWKFYCWEDCRTKKIIMMLN